MDQEFGVSTLVEEEFGQRRQVKLQQLGGGGGVEPGVGGWGRGVLSLVLGSQGLVGRAPDPAGPSASLLGPVQCPGPAGPHRGACH